MRVGERLYSERDNVVSKVVTLMLFVIPSPKEFLSYPGTLRINARSPDGDIFASDKEKAPFSRGACFDVRNPQERVPLTQYHAK